VIRFAFPKLLNATMSFTKHASQSGLRSMINVRFVALTL
jgi:hypothetical protein